MAPWASFSVSPACFTPPTVPTTVNASASFPASEPSHNRWPIALTCGQEYRAKIVAGDSVRIVPSHGFARAPKVTRHRGGAFADVATERHIVDHARGQHSRQVVEFVHQAFHKFQAACLRVVCPRKQDLPGQDVVRLEARRNGHHSLKTEAEQTRSGQQNKRQGNLRDEKTVTQDLSAVPARAAAALRLKRISEMPPKIEASDGHREHDAHDDG